MGRGSPCVLALVCASVVGASAPPATAAEGLGAPAIPARKAGWWEITMTTGAKPQVIRMCTDAATEKANSAVGTDLSALGKCSQSTISRTPAGWSFASTCKVGSFTTSSTGTATGDFSTRYRVESVTKMTPAPTPALAQTHMVIEAKWAGPCPADRKPGDMVMGNGMVMRMKK